MPRAVVAPVMPRNTSPQRVHLGRGDYVQRSLELRERLPLKDVPVPFQQRGSQRGRQAVQGVPIAGGQRVVIRGQGWDKEERRVAQAHIFVATEVLFYPQFPHPGQPPVLWVRRPREGGMRHPYPTLPGPQAVEGSLVVFGQLVHPKHGELGRVILAYLVQVAETEHSAPELLGQGKIVVRLIHMA